MRHLLYRLGFTCTRPTYTLAKADPEKQAAFREAFEVQRQTLPKVYAGCGLSLKRVVQTKLVFHNVRESESKLEDSSPS